MTDYIKKKELETGDITNLPAERKREIIEIKNNMDISYQGTMEFGNEASKNLSEFSTELLQSVKMKIL